jgi:hypothetical protein
MDPRIRIHTKMSWIQNTVPSLLLEGLCAACLVCEGLVRGPTRWGLQQGAVQRLQQVLHLKK